MSWKPYSAFRRVSIKIRTVTSRGGGGGGGDGGFSSDKYFFKLLKSLCMGGRKEDPAPSCRTHRIKARMEAGADARGRQGADMRGRQG